MIIEKQMEAYFDRLYPICRSISGEGYQESLDIISEIIPLEKIVEFLTRIWSAAKYN